MQMLKINKNWTLTLPKAFRALFKPSDELACFIEGDTLIIKRINPPKLTELAERVEESPIPLSKIVKEVHAYRKEKRQK